MTWRRETKRALARAGRLLRRQSRRVILCYHSVSPMPWDLSTEPHAFEAHLRWLKEACHVVGLSEAVSTPPPEAPRKPIVAITFDDGYEDNHSVALPLLSKHGIPATFFITTGLAEHDPAALDRFSRTIRRDVRDLGVLNWAQVADLRASGMTIGNHTHTHPDMARLSPEEARREVHQARELLSSHLGEAVDLFAYPFGRPRVHFTRVTESLVREAGHRMAFSAVYRQVRPSDLPFRIPRLFVDGDDLDKLRDKVLGAYDPIGWWQEHAPRPLMRMVSPELRALD